jgi:hypothetical protein
MRKLLTWLLVTLGVAALIRKLRRRNGERSTEPSTTRDAGFAGVGVGSDQPEPPSTWSSASVATEEAPPASDAPSAEDPADELRRKLAETKNAEEPQEAAPAGEPAVEGSVEERRADVHEQARATLDEMKSSEET